MTYSVTYQDVFDFMGTRPDVAAANRKAVDDLLQRICTSVENKLKRKLESFTATNVVFTAGVNATVSDSALILHGKYKDIISISALSETGTALTESTSYNDGGDYILNKAAGSILKVYGTWSGEANAIKLSGSFGLVDEDGQMPEDIKQYIIESVAAKSGLWSKQFINSDGAVDVYVRTTIDKETSDILNRYLGGGHA